MHPKRDAPQVGRLPTQRQQLSGGQDSLSRLHGQRAASGDGQGQIVSVPTLSQPSSPKRTLHSRGTSSTMSRSKPLNMAVRFIQKQLPLEESVPI